MAAQALYRRWRPQTFEDAIGQEPVTRTLRNAVATGRLAHAYLFTGVRGTGKTSVARILAKAVNCTGDGEKPCNACHACRSITEGRALDLIEIDAASNTGVDDVRDLRDKIHFSPNELTYKVYIVDEVHMLSTAAFNALLKTLEEPPEHAIFILATTEPHKVPDTIVSRCQRHDFKRVSREVLVSKLERICRAEGAQADRAALELVARGATGSFRDAESLLDQVLATGEDVTVELVRATLGTPTAVVVAELVEALVALDAAAGLKSVTAALDQGVDPRQLQSQVLEHLRALMLLQVGMDEALLDQPDEALAQLRDQASRVAPAALTATIRRFNEARPSPDRSQPGLPLELAVVETVLAGTAPPAADRPAPPPAPTARAPETVPAAAPSRPPAARERPAEPAPKPVASRAAPAEATRPGPRPGAASGPELGRVVSRWPEVLAAVAGRDKNIAALLKDCRPVAAEPGRVTLGFFFPFHAERVRESPRAQTVEAALAEVLGDAWHLECTVVPASAEEDAARPRTKADQARTDPMIKHALDHLGARISGVEATDQAADEGKP